MKLTLPFLSSCLPKPPRTRMLYTYSTHAYRATQLTTGFNVAFCNCTREVDSRTSCSIFLLVIKMRLVPHGLSHCKLTVPKFNPLFILRQWSIFTDGSHTSSIAFFHFPLWNTPMSGSICTTKIHLLIGSSPTWKMETWTAPVEAIISSTLSDCFAFVLDGQKTSNYHFVSLFATSTASNSAGYTAGCLVLSITIWKRRQDGCRRAPEFYAFHAIHFWQAIE